uniref:Tryptophan synthase alpha chain n=1 Tax=Rhodymenia pseudopalmata TaxID=31502 RepID=A0A1C9C7M2_RHOPU|nr:tryptophan synthase alpha subunit [Rhodymenia pseudopalmata]AOM64370.1 tryptophan synthase alpha subunit [Rhodymenia pseudopalmata]
MNAISEILRKKNSTCALIPFITAGYPTISQSIEALRVLDSKGADIIELGVPYSDALADGPIIQESSKIALEQGVYVEQVLKILSIASSSLSAPIVIFTYYNPVLSMGIQKFVQEIAASGAKGLLIPDLPFEETDYVIGLCKSFNIELILFIAPTSSQKRIDSILSKSPGCIYLVSSCGVTGMKKQLDDRIHGLLKSIKAKTGKLVMIGFGISNSDQAYQVSKYDVDGIVIGSAFIKLISSSTKNEMIDSLGEFCNSIRAAISVNYPQGNSNPRYLREREMS